MTQTPDQDLSARLAEFAKSDCRDNEFAKWCQTAWQAYSTGQLITLADHDRAVQAAVADARLEMINSLKDEIARQEGQGGEGSSLWCVIDGERTIHEIHAQERMDARVQAAVARAVEACAVIADECEITLPLGVGLACGASMAIRQVAAAIRSRGVKG